MSDQKIDYRSLMTKALTEIKELKGELRERKQRSQEPIAIIGASCRLPGGANSLDQYWDLLQQGKDAIVRVPAERWDAEEFYSADVDEPGKICTKEGGFIDQSVREFDSSFFSISPREAENMDPQQRLLLELSWEAIENANILPDSLFKSHTGVFIGVSSLDNVTRLIGEGPFSDINAYSGTGTALAPVAGRLSYYFGFTGPSYIVDTACSSSMLSLHLACESLRRGECEMALGGGIQLLTHPGISIAFTKARMLSPDGRCKSFDASANGYVRGEGGGVVLLKRLSDALRDGDQIHALIRGSAVNQDGPSGGLTVPSGPSQEMVIRTALENAGVHPSDVNYIEAHGTGTSLGDPIELGAVSNVYAEYRSKKDPLYVASVKSNIGHLEAGAGIASVLKVMLSLKNKQIAPHLHFKTPNPMIDWERLPLHIPQLTIEWQPVNSDKDGGKSGDSGLSEPKTSRFAATSSFGFSGTNVHMILEEAPVVASSENGSESNQLEDAFTKKSLKASQKKGATSVERPLILAISAKDQGALQQLAGSYAKRLAAADFSDYESLLYTAATSRTAFAHRLSLSATTSEEATDRLEEWVEQVKATDNPSGLTGIQYSIADDQTLPSVGVLFTGQGAQYAGMGQALYDVEPVFAEIVDRCCEIIDPILGESLKEVMFSESEKLDQTGFTQPALFTLELASATLWKSYGGTIDAVVGHSVGEYAAAVIAGVMSLEDAAFLIAKRGQLMQQLPEGGGMLAVLTDSKSVKDVLESVSNHSISLAAVNSSRNVVISGPLKEIEKVKPFFEKQGHEIRELRVSHAFHSSLMDLMLDDFRQEVSKISLHDANISIFTNADGGLNNGQMQDPEYWVQHVRNTVEFEKAFQSMVESGVNCFVESGPKPTLLSLGRVIAEEMGHWTAENDACWNALLKKEQPLHAFSTALGAFWTRGGEPDWKAFFTRIHDRSLPQKTQLPSYPFQREVHWKEVPIGDDKRLSLNSDADAKNISVHPLLGDRIESPIFSEDSALFAQEVTLRDVSFLDHHKVFGHIILPAAAHMEMALSAISFEEKYEKSGKQKNRLKPLNQGQITAEYRQRSLQLRDVTIDQALEFPEEGVLQIQTLLSDRKTGTFFEIFTKTEGSSTWTRHTSGEVTTIKPVGVSKSEAPVLEEIRKRCKKEISVSGYYQKTRELGVDHGEDFQSLKNLWVGKNEVLGIIELPKALKKSNFTECIEEFKIHPVMLDAAFHMVSIPLIDLDKPYLPIGLDQFVVHQSIGEKLWCYISAEFPNDDQAPPVYQANITLFNERGGIVGEIEGLRYHRIEQKLFKAKSETDSWFYGLNWVNTALYGGASKQLKTPVEVKQILEPMIRNGIRDCHFYGGLFDDFDHYSAGSIQEALLKAGWNPDPGVQFDGSELADQVGVQPEFRALFRRSLQILEEDGVLKKVASDQWEVKKKLSTTRLSAEAMIEKYPQAVAEISLLTRCASELLQVWRGKRDPLELLFPPEDDVTTNLYRQSEGAKTMNGLLSEAVKEAVAALPLHQGLRVVEVGAGTGGSTVQVLPILPPDRTDYVFTDLSSHFTNSAEKLFGEEYPFLKTAILDIEKPISSEKQGSADIVIAANVLHATQNLKETLLNCYDLLAPGGMLVMLEGLPKQRWFDLTFGMTEGWWRFTDVDPNRGDYPLLSQSEWTKIGTETGYEELAFLNVDPPKKGERGLNQNVILARKPVLDSSETMSLPEGKWLVVGSEQSPIHASLKKAKRDWVWVDAEELILNPKEGERLAEALKEGVDGILFAHSLQDLEAGDVSIDQANNDLKIDLTEIERLNLPIIETLRQLGQIDMSEHPRIWCLTSQSAAEKRDALAFHDVSRSTLTGLFRTILNESPEFEPTLLELRYDDLPNADDIMKVWSNEAQTPFSDPVIRYSVSGRQVARLDRDESVSVDREMSALTMDKNAAYVITGGLGALGLKVAESLAEQGAGELILMGRSGPSKEVEQVLQAMRDAGTEVQTCQVDVSDYESLSKTWPSLTDREIKGVIHAAGTLNDGILNQMDREKFLSVMPAKILGSWNLHLLTKDSELDFFILFSSVGAIFGPTAQANYAAANAFMDELAHLRRSLDLPALSINWGAWAEIGLAASRSEKTLSGIKRALPDIQSDLGIEAFGKSLFKNGQLLLLPISWKELLEELPNLRLMDAFRDQDSEKETTEHSTTDHWVDQLKQLSSTEQIDEMKSLVTEKVAKVLGIKAEKVDHKTGFFDLGMDSLTSVELRNALQNTLGLNLPSTLIFKYPNIEAVSDYLLSELVPVVEEQTEETLDESLNGHSKGAANSSASTVGAGDITEMSEEDLNALIDSEFENLDSDE